MTIDRTDPTILKNYITFPYAVKPTKWQETAAKVAMIVVHILLSIATFGYYAIKTADQYYADIKQNGIVVPPIPIPPPQFAATPPPAAPPPPPVPPPLPDPAAQLQRVAAAPPKPIQMIEVFDISSGQGMWMLLETMRNVNKIYFKFEGDHLSIVTKDQFDALYDAEKKAVVEGLEKVIDNIIANESLNEGYSKQKNAIRRIRNEIHISLNPSKNGLSMFPRDLLEQLILGRTSPKQVEEAKEVNTKFKAAATDLAKIKSINYGLLRLRDALPQKITNATEAIQWLERNKARESLRYANFIGFDDFNEKHLERLTEICPKLSELTIRSNKIIRLGNLPDSLTRFSCFGCQNLAIMTKLPSSLTDFDCSDCSTLRKLPELPSTLIKLSCRSNLLEELPVLPDNLEVLYCNGNGQLKKLPKLPASLRELNCFLCYGLKELPGLPDSLTYLNCSSCAALTKLPQLPDFLKKLQCVDLQALKELPELPSSLAELSCSDCQSLTKLPKLPVSLTNLECNSCYALKELPELPPSLASLNINRCGALVKLPELPASLRLIFCSNCDKLTNRPYESTGSLIVC